MTDEHPDWPVGEIREYSWLRHGDPLPDGHEVADAEAVMSHHHGYARLVRRVGDADPAGE